MAEATMTGAGWQRRYTLIGLCFLAVFICYIDRVNISVAIIPMAKDYRWDPQQQGLVLASFFFGYILTQFLGGRLADRFGGKLVLGLGVVTWSVFTMLTPIAAGAGFITLLLARIGMGLGEGFTFPAIYSLIGRWIPAAERSRAVSVNFSGIPAGTLFALALTPLIAVQFGWQWVFYIFGSFGLIWFAFWMLKVTSWPQQHPNLSAQEFALIRRGTDAEQVAVKLPPLKKLLSNKPLWAIIVSHFCNNWALYVLLSWMPTYVNKALHVDFASVGFYTMVPNIASLMFLGVAGWTTDALIRRGFGRTNIRKTMQSVGFGAVVTALACVGYVHSAIGAIAIMTVGNAIGAFAMGGYGSNHLDIAPRHAGTLMGITNTAATIPGIIGVYVSGEILNATGSWILVFQVAAGVVLFGLVFYALFASTEQPEDTLPPVPPAAQPAVAEPAAPLPL